MARVLAVDGGGTIGQVRINGRLGYIEDGRAFSFLQPGERDLLKMLGVDELQQAFNKDSTLITPDDWGAVARLILERVDEFEGFVISQGTDSLAYTASALSWMLGSIGKPVVLTGAMIPMRDEAALGRADGWANLVNAVRVAASGRIPEVVIVFGSVILRGNRATKGLTFALDSFESPNCRPLGTIGKDISYDPGYTLPFAEQRTPAIPERWPRVGWVKSFPGQDSSTLGAYLRGIEGCVLETFGSGSLPLEIIDEIHKAAIPAVMCLPGNQGPLDAFYFDPSLWVEARLVVSGRDMTREASITKLLWAIGVSDDALETTRLLRANLAGEMHGEIRPYYDSGPAGATESKQGSTSS